MSSGQGPKLEPEHPRDSGLAEEMPDQAHIEGAELLANQARPILSHLGFTDDEINEWALTYIAENRSGDVGSFLSWVSAVERR